MPLLTGEPTTCDPLGALDVGDQIGQRVLITDLDNKVPTDTDLVEVTLRKPNGTVVTVTAVHEGTGQYFILFPVFDQSGIWRWRTQASGLVNEASQGRLRVRRQVV
jgi:hypothetical protein